MIQLHSQETAPESAAPILAAVENSNGFTPNLFRALANSPSTLGGFMALMEENDRGTLSPAERQIVQLTASRENHGSYCVAGHSTFAENMGMSVETIAALRGGEPLPNERYDALVNLTRALIQGRGQLTDSDLGAFVAGGFDIEQMLEVIACIALKTITNYVSSAYNLPLDKEFQSQVWFETVSGIAEIAQAS
jgi:uncharacterized peroxidase-related enzyme